MKPILVYDWDLEVWIGKTHIDTVIITGWLIRYLVQWEIG